jgi:outer membrane protein
MKGVCLAIAAVLLAHAALAQSVPKIGYVDLQRALNESDAGRRAKAAFKVQVDKLQAKLKKQKDALDDLKQELDRKATVMKEAELGQLEDDYRKRLRDFERAYKDSQTDLQSRDNELTGSIIKDLQGVIQDYGKRENYTLILESTSAAVLYGAKNADLTDEIIREYNNRHSKNAD